MTELKKFKVGDVICWLEYDEETHRWHTIIGKLYKIEEGLYLCENFLQSSDVPYAPDGKVSEDEVWHIDEYSKLVLYRDILNVKITLSVEQLEQIADMIEQNSELISDFDNVEARR